jgi:hypothetical protein
MFAVVCPRLVSVSIRTYVQIQRLEVPVSGLKAVLVLSKSGKNR